MHAADPPLASDPASGTSTAHAAESALRPDPYTEWLERPPAARPRLAAWNVYFLAKFALAWQGLIGLHAIENLAFAVALLVPLRQRTLAVMRTVAAIPVAVALLYHDSFLPPISRLFAQASQVSHFSLGYLFELSQRFVSWPAVASIVLAAAAYAIAVQRLRVGVMVIGSLAVMSVLQRPPSLGVDTAAARTEPTSLGTKPIVARAEPADLDAVLRTRYAEEGSRKVAFAAPPAGAVPFDVVFLHVCSMSWDDLRATGLERHPLLARLDIVLERFNSAASYSGPAVIRMLRAPCGQVSHSALYSQPPDNACYLMPSLKQAGFEPRLVLNHDGHFDDFIGVVRAQGNAALKAQPLDSLPVAQRSFDDSPIFDDLAVLRRHVIRPSGDATRVATYYNTISLHDGNRLVGAHAGLKSLDSYKIRLTKLLDDLDAFLTELERSGRRAVVVLLPEHGAAFRGDKMQVAGMREVPTPAITHVPVGLKVIGEGARRRDEPARVAEPTSYLAVSQIVARMLQRPPFDVGGFAARDYTKDLPTTPYVAENSGTVMLGKDDKYFLRFGNDGWIEYQGVQP